MNRLLCIINNMNMGGAETFLMKVYRTIDRKNYQMDFCVNVSGKCDYEDEIKQMGGRFFRISPKSDNSKEFKKQLKKIVHDNSYDNVLRVTSNAAGFWDLKIAKKAGATHTIARSSNADDGNKLQRLINSVGRALWGRYVDEKIAPSDLAAAYTFGKKALIRGEVKKLNNGLDLSAFCFSDEGRNKVREEFNISSQTSVIGHIGRFNTQKNHRFLLMFFNEYRKSNPDSVLMLVGVGTLEEQIKKLADDLGLADSVIFTGLRKDIPDLLSAFDLLAMPSLYEGMPNVVIEAQACGVPCILSDTITREANLSGEVVFLSTSNTKEWVEQSEKSVKNGRVYTDMSMYDINRVSQEFCNYCFSKKGAVCR